MSARPAFCLASNPGSEMRSIASPCSASARSTWPQRVDRAHANDDAAGLGAGDDALPCSPMMTASACSVVSTMQIVRSVAPATAAGVVSTAAPASELLDFAARACQRDTSPGSWRAFRNA